MYFYLMPIARYQQLNPFLVYHDKYSYNSGNPYLDPCYNYHIEFSYRYKQFLTLGAHYDHVDDIIFSTTAAEGDLFITRPDNIAHGHILFVVVNLSLSPAKMVEPQFQRPTIFSIHRSIITRPPISSMPPPSIRIERIPAVWAWPLIIASARTPACVRKSVTTT